jgi:hypothetical protein
MQHALDKHTQTKPKVTHAHALNMKSVISLKGFAQALRRHPIVEKEGRMTVPMKHRARTTKVSARLARSIRGYASFWNDWSTQSNSFFNQLKADLNDLLEENRFQRVVDMKAIQVLPKKNQDGSFDSAIGVLLCNTLTTDENDHETKNTAACLGYFIVQVSPSSNEYKMFTVIFKEDETPTEFVPGKTPARCSPRLTEAQRAQEASE